MRRAVLVAFAWHLALVPAGTRAADLVVWWNEGWYEQEDQAVREIVAAFEKETGKKVELVFQPEEATRAEVEAALGRGEPPDFIWGPLSFSWTPEWAHEGRLVDLADTIGPVAELFDPDVLEASMLLDGTSGRRALYALPMGRTSNHVHVWTSLLERAGFTLDDIPEQWDAFWSFWCDEVQPAVRDALGRDDVWGVGLPMSRDGGDTQDQLMQFQLAHGTSWFDLEHRLQIDDPEVREGMVEALDSYTGIWRKSCTPPDATAWTNYGNNKAFLDQRVLLTLNPTLSIPGELREQRPEDYYDHAATIAWPSAMDGEPLVLLAALQRGVVLRAGANTELAKAFVRFLADGWLAHWLSFAGDRYLPPMRSLIEQPFWLDGRDPHRLRAAVQALNQPHVIDAGIKDREWRSVRVYQENVWGKAVHRVVTGNIDPEQAVDEAIARIKEILEE